MWCVNLVDFEVCFAPQACLVFSTSQLPRVLRPCAFLPFLLPSVLRLLNISTSTSAPRIRGFAHFDFETISPDGSWSAALASLLFDPPEPQIIWKTQWFATVPPFRAPASSFFWRFLFSDFFSSFLFSGFCHLCCFICPYCQKLDF